MMKKIISLLSIILIFTVLLIGCTASFDVNETIKNLEKSGLKLGFDYKSEQELKNATNVINGEIKIMGGDFTVELKGAKALIENNDYSKSVIIYTFANKEQAKAYGELYVKGRGESKWKVAINDELVILTNLKNAVKTINLEFK